MTDLGVRCYGDLARHYTEGVDYAVHVAPRERSGIAILAPHGGRIEGRTSEIARLIAGEDYGLYLFEGLRTTGDNFDCLHLASSQFDEPRALELISNCHTVVTVHGYAASGPDVLLGGLNERLEAGGCTGAGDERILVPDRGTPLPGQSSRQHLQSRAIRRGAATRVERGIAKGGRLAALRRRSAYGSRRSGRLVDSCRRMQGGLQPYG